jgi:hypothetical protein
MAKFSWDEEDMVGITVEPAPLDDVNASGLELAAEIARVDSILLAAGVEVSDAAPEPLYVSRKVLNPDDILRWAKTQGITSTLKAEDLHVTVIYSRTPVDWMAMGSAYEEEVVVHPGGPRRVSTFGEGATVLEFHARALTWRHQEMVDAGASWDWPAYQPHITLTYEPQDGRRFAPYIGEIRLGPEIFEPIKDSSEN